MNEKDIIQKYFTKELNDQSIIEGIGDDAAIIRANNGCELVITTDTMVEDRHFSKFAPAYAVGYKLMASNLSDIAAMGASPRWATLNLTLSTLNQSWLENFSKGLLECAQKHNVTLVGGDTTHGERLNISIQLIGEVPKGEAMLRNGAQVGDLIFVTGIIGNAASALNILQKNDFNHDDLSAIQYAALYMPQSRIDFAIELRDIANAAIDISDGLLNELEIICKASHVGAALQLNDIPVNCDINIDQSITGGEDYELIFTVPNELISHVELLSKKHNCSTSKIGEITNNKIVEIYQGNHVIPYPEYSGYDHFDK
ncbi:MAG: thiamine-phosphate kinase [Gammaproteobacteria bacterium]